MRCQCPSATERATPTASLGRSHWTWRSETLKQSLKQTPKQTLKQTQKRHSRKCLKRLRRPSQSWSQ